MVSTGGAKDPQIRLMRDSDASRDWRWRNSGGIMRADFSADDGSSWTELLRFDSNDLRVSGSVNISGVLQDSNGNEYAKYQFTDNNFNGSGNFTTTGNITADTFKGDWSGGNVDGDINMRTNQLLNTGGIQTNDFFGCDNSLFDCPFSVDPFLDPIDLVVGGSHRYRFFVNGTGGEAGSFFPEFQNTFSTKEITLGKSSKKWSDLWLQNTAYFGGTIGNNVKIILNGTDGNGNFTGNVTASFFKGDGSQLTGISIFNQTYQDKADYEFTNNNFNGSGDFTTTGNITADSLFINLINATANINSATLSIGTTLGADDAVTILGTIGSTSDGKGISIISGEGEGEASAGPGAQRGKKGGAFDFLSGDGASDTDEGAFSNTGGASGSFLLATGSGGTATGTTVANTGGASGVVTISAGTAASTTTSNTATNRGGAGGGFLLGAGRGGDASDGSTNTGGAGGNVQFNGGIGGEGTEVGGDGGDLNFVSGFAGDGITPGTQGQIFFFAGGILGSSGSIKVLSTLADQSGIQQDDNIKHFLGTGLDLEIFHDSTNSIIFNNNGNLILNNSLGSGKIIFGNDLIQLSPNNTAITCNSGNAGGIYYDGNLNKHLGCNSTTWNELY